MSDRNRQFLDYYEKNRVGDQESYYRAQSEYNNRRNDLAVVVTGLLMFVATVSSGIVLAEWSFLGDPIYWSISATVAPALSGAVAATRNLFEYERNHERYFNTLLDLEMMRAELAPSRRVSDHELRAQLAEYVSKVEELLSLEHRQWVQMMEQTRLVEPPQPPELDEEE